jgi:hypothetical protein
MWQENSPVLTRRNWLALAGAGLAPWRGLLGFGKEFWESKDPAEWSADEISRLLGKSPWAKTVSAERVKTQKNTMPSDPMPPPVNPRSRNSGMGKPPSARTPSTKTVTTYTGEVVWESAAPVRAALKSKLPEGFEGQYVLGMSGVPLAKSDGKGALDKLRQATSLHTKNHQPLQPGPLKVLHENGTVYLFGFSKEGLSLNREEKEVVFTTHMGNLAFTAKFNPRDMLYHGELAV